MPWHKNAGGAYDAGLGKVSDSSVPVEPHRDKLFGQNGSRACSRTGRRLRCKCFEEISRPSIRLGDQQFVDIDPDLAGIHRVDGVLGVDVGADPTHPLGLGDHVHGQGGLA